MGWPARFFADRVDRRLHTGVDLDAGMAYRIPEPAAWIFYGTLCGRFWQLDPLFSRLVREPSTAEEEDGTQRFTRPVLGPDPPARWPGAGTDAARRLRLCPDLCELYSAWYRVLSAPASRPESGPDLARYLSPHIVGLPIPDALDMRAVGQRSV